MITTPTPKRTYHFVGNSLRDGTIRRVEVRSTSQGEAEKSAKSKLSNPRLTGSQP